MNHISCIDCSTIPSNWYSFITLWIKSITSWCFCVSVCLLHVWSGMSWHQLTMTIQFEYYLFLLSSNHLKISVLRIQLLTTVKFPISFLMPVFIYIQYNCWKLRRKGVKWGTVCVVRREGEGGSRWKYKVYFYFTFSLYNFAAIFSAIVVCIVIWTDEDDTVLCGSRSELRGDIELGKEII